MFKIDLLINNTKLIYMKTKIYFRKIAFVAMSLFASSSYANNLKITGTTIDSSAGTVTFNIQWDNSWKTNIAPSNYDAVWVFIKYQDCSDKLWKHANLSSTSSDHSTTSLLKIDAVTDGKGVFIYRNANGGGNIPSTSITLKMNVASANYENYNFKVSGIEMVNIPQGSFWIGDTTNIGFGVSSSTPAYTYQVTSENSNLAAGSIGTGNTAGSNFPKGYKSFYSMKYEITQEQYVEFLNTLTYKQQARRSIASPDSAANTFAFNSTYGNGVKIKTPGNNASIPAVYGCDLVTGDFDDLNDGQNNAMNWLNWEDVKAYLDWSALRPMTEIEFEKICRGPLDPVAGEYVWGTTTINNVIASGVINAGTGNEGYNSVADGRANYGVYPTSYTKPTKVGFTATNSSGRASASASYYGVMEMGGNVTEMTITAKATAANFINKTGDGNLSELAATAGDADITEWPDTTGTIMRGGSLGGSETWNYNGASLVRTSDRNGGAVGTTRYQGYGGRGVR